MCKAPCILRFALWVSLSSAPLQAQTSVPCWDDIFRPQDQGFPAVGDPASSPGPKAFWDSRIFFAALRRPLGQELFWTAACIGDYFPNPQGLFKGYHDIAAQQPDQSSRPREFVVYGGRLFFVADVWVGNVFRTGVLFTMGPESGDQIADPYPVDLPAKRAFVGPNRPSLGSFFEIRDLTLHQGQLWFTATGTIRGWGFGRYPWYIADPDSGRTNVVLLKPRDSTGGNSHNVLELESAGPNMAMIVHFPYSDPAFSSRDVWIAQGIGNGFSPTARRIATEMNEAAELTYESVHSTLYWRTRNEPFGGNPLRGYLWASDLEVPGPESTYPIRDEAGEPFDPGELYAASGQLYFTAERTGQGREVHRTDGSTTVSWDLAPGPFSSDPFDYVEHLGFVFFLTRADPGFDDGLFRSDLLTLPIDRLETMDTPRDLTLLENGILYWSGRLIEDGVDLGQELWRTYGVFPGSAWTTDLNPGGASSDPSDFVYYGVTDDVLCSATHSTLFRELVWVD